MATITDLQLDFPSASTTGEPIQVTGTTAGTADLLHTVADGTTDIVTVTASNINTSDETVTVTIGGATDADKVNVVVTTAGSRVVLNRHPIKASGADIEIRAYAQTTLKVNCLVEVLSKQDITSI